MKAYVPALIPVAVALLLLLLLRGNGYATNILILVCLHGTIAVAWNMAAGFTGLLSLGHALFVGAGAYAVAATSVWAGWNVWSGLLAGVVVAVIAAASIGMLCFRYGVRGYYFGIATLAFSEIAFFLVSSAVVFGRSDGMMLPRREDGWLTLSFEAKWPYGLVCIVLLAATLVASIWLLKRRSGSYWRAIRDNEEAAEALGVPVLRYKLFSFCLSAGLSAAAGGLYAAYIGFVDPRSVLGPEVSVQALVFSIVGGLGQVWGPLLGAAILVPTGELLRIFVGGSINGVAIMVYAVILILLSLKLPAGVGGWLVDRRRGAVGESLAGEAAGDELAKGRP